MVPIYPLSAVSVAALVILVSLTLKKSENGIHYKSLVV
jgi:hypothetical protein